MENLETHEKIDCEQSLSFPRVAICEGRAQAVRSASPHSLLVSFPNLHNINSSARRGFQEQKPTTRSLMKKNLEILLKNSEILFFPDQD